MPQALLEQKLLVPQEQQEPPLVLQLLALRLGMPLEAF
jgi:hypothetical protein